MQVHFDETPGVIGQQEYDEDQEQQQQEDYEDEEGLENNGNERVDIERGFG